MAEDQAQRTEPATPKKKEDARKKGQVAQSRDLQSAAVLCGAALALAATGIGIGHALSAGMRTSFDLAARPPDSLASFYAALLQLSLPSALALMPLLIVAPLSAGALQFVQVGPMFSPEAMQLRWDRLDLVKGLGRMVKVDRWVELAKTVAKVVLISLAAWWAFVPELDRVFGLSAATLGESIGTFGELLGRVVVATLSVLIVIAAIDVAFQRKNHDKQLRMSKREVRDELKQSEGDSQLRSRFRARQRELSSSRMIAAVAEATVVVTNPTHFAVALRYDRGQMAAPEVVAKGKDRVAARIRDAAEQAGVPIIEEPPLARLLHRTCQIGHEIPTNLFQAVAEVLALVQRVNDNRAQARPVQ